MLIRVLQVRILSSFNIKIKAKVCDTEQIKCTYRSCNMEASGTRKESDERVKLTICVNRRHPVNPQERGGELNVMILYREV